MKGLILGLMAALLAALASAAVTAADPLRGEPRALAAAGGFGNFTFLDEPRPVPEVRFVDADERARALSDFRGKVVLLNLWATWCAPCRHEMPTLDRLQARLGGPRFQVVALAVDRGGIDKVRAFLEELGIRHLEAYNDPSMRAMRALGAYGLPTTLLIDGRGDEVGRLIGPAEWDSPEFVELIRQVIRAGKDDRSQARAPAPASAPS